MGVAAGSTNQAVRVRGQYYGAVLGGLGELPQGAGKGVGRFRFFTMDGGEDQELARLRGTPDLEWKPENRAPIRCGRPLYGPPQRTWAKVQGITGFVFATNRVKISSRF